MNNKIFDNSVQDKSSNVSADSVSSSAPLDHLAYRHPVSIKGVLSVGGKIVLLKNEREEWELPGGKLDPGEQPQECLKREVIEELGIEVEIRSILDAWLYKIDEKNLVVIITYGCNDIKSTPLYLSHEHKALGLFEYDEIASLKMPAGYKESIRSWFVDLRGPTIIGTENRVAHVTNQVKPGLG